MTNIHDFQDRGEAARQAAGIDGTAGDAQDVRHRFVRDEPHPWCLLCGLNENWRKHIDRPLDCGLCYEENGEEVHPIRSAPSPHPRRPADALPEDPPAPPRRRVSDA